MSGPRVLLVGMMGAGKSTIGLAIAEQTGWAYLDNDTLVAQAKGRATPDVLRERGVATLRAAESAALTEALMLPTPVVAGIAGGVVLDRADRDRLHAGGFVVWLRAELATLAARVGAGAGRPWLAPDPLTALTALYDGRPELYAQVAHLVIDVDHAAPVEIARQIIAAADPR